MRISYINQNQKIQDPRTIKMKEIEQLQQNNFKTQKSQKEQPFIINRQQYKELNLYQRKGHWSQKEKLKYILFLEHFKERFQVKAKRRFNNIFDFMAVFIKTRNSHQCRSHHQKMQKEKFAIGQLINSVKQKYPTQIYESMKQRYWQELERIDIDKNENFEQFRQRIEKLEQKRQNQRQKIAQNKRILRSTMPKTSNRQGNGIKRNKLKNKHITSGETHQKKISSQNHMEPVQDRFFKIQQVQNQHTSNIANNGLNKLQSYSLNGIQPIMTFPSTPLSAEIMFQPYCFVPNNHSTLSDLQNKHKEHMNLAFIHYNQYLKHTNNANNIHLQLVNLYNSLMEGNYHI